MSRKPGRCGRRLNPGYNPNPNSNPGPNPAPTPLAPTPTPSPNPNPNPSPNPNPTQVDVDILGLMWLGGLTIDIVTIINLVLAIGLVVDYSAHIAHSFVVAKGTRQARADHTR